MAKMPSELWQQLQNIDIGNKSKDPYERLDPTMTLLLMDPPPFDMPQPIPPLAPRAWPTGNTPISHTSNSDIELEKEWKLATDGFAATLAPSVDAWQIATLYLRPRHISQPPPMTDPVKVEHAFMALKKQNMWPFLSRFWLESVRQSFGWPREEIKSAMEQWEAKMTTKTIAKLITRVHEWCLLWAQPLDAFKEDETFQKVTRGAYIRAFRAGFLSVLPPSFNAGLRLFLRTTIPDLPAHAEMFQHLEVLGIMERFDRTFTDVLFEEIDAKVAELCPGKWTEPKLEEMRKQTKELEDKWLETVYGPKFGMPQKNDIFKGAMMMVTGRLEYHLTKNLIDLRTTEIFEIIVEFPESLPAVTDLRNCLYRNLFRHDFVQGLQEVISRRILQPAAETNDIITFYVNLIRVLRVIDPQGVILHRVAAAIRKYLRDRPDTVRCIVKRMTDENESLLDDGEHVVPIQRLYEPYDDYSDPNWIPEPTDAPPDFRTSRRLDIVSTLVSIYDTQDLFIKELQNILASRLLAIKTTHLDEEIKSVEMLKMRFGEAPLQVCAVMLKDLTDSRRTNAHIHADGPTLQALQPTIISRLFWPTVPTVPLKMPGQFQELQGKFEKGFRQFKPDKKLRWLPQLGVVSLELELKDRKVEVEATPIQAGLIELFANHDNWKAEDLMAALGGIERLLVQSALDFWMAEGVVKKDGDHYTLMEEAETGRTARGRRLVAKEEEPGLDEVEQQQAAQMKMYWQFIKGILTNLSAVPIDRIQTMMKFAPGYDKTVQELTVFLESARKEGLVAFVNGKWKLASN